LVNVIHVSHEAVHKVGGIGAVLEGLITAGPYRQAVGRTVLLGPLFDREGDPATRLGDDAEILYSSRDGRTDHPAADALSDVEYRYGTTIIYGRRKMRAVDTGLTADPDVILVDVAHADPAALGRFKFRLFEAFRIASDQYQDVWDFEQYVRLAMPGLEAARAVGACGREIPTVVVAHEFMGMPTALAAKLHPEWNCRAVFHAHEVATVRRLIEHLPSGELGFYTAMRAATQRGLRLEDVFGPQDGYFKHPLVVGAKHCDGVLAVGDLVADELRFLDAGLADAPIHTVYNGIPADAGTLEDAASARDRMKRYATNLIGGPPDHIFTHVTRLVRSKGLWRDLDVLRRIDARFQRDGRTGVLFVLSTEIGRPRSPDDIRRMERAYGWPVAHREGYPDLTQGEAEYYATVQAFNASARNVKAIFINQFGFDRDRCGMRVPDGIQFWDIRRGSDVEFGMSIYEPFGIAQVEAMSFGALCAISNVCGCAGLVRQAAAALEGTPAMGCTKGDTGVGTAAEVLGGNVIAADYTRADSAIDDPAVALKLTAEDARQVEQRVARELADRILSRLPINGAGRAESLARGHALAKRMSWSVVARDAFLPAIDAAVRAGSGG
jgi:glycosyltransferase involved in cell wall biosynthesis